MISEEAPEIRAVARKARRLRVTDENRDVLEYLLARSFPYESQCGMPGCSNPKTQLQSFSDAWDILESEYPDFHEQLLDVYWSLIWWMAQGYATRTAEILAGPAGDAAETKVALEALEALGYAHEYTADEIAADPVPISAPPGLAPIFDCTTHQYARYAERRSGATR